VIEVPREKPNESKLKTLFLGYGQVNEIIPIKSYDIVDNEIIIQPYDASSPEQIIPLDVFPTSASVESEFIYTKKFWLGTDRYGRDLLSRLIIGTRISISIGFVAVFISLVLGIILGAISGYYGGKVDQVIMWLINVTWSIPTLLLVIALTLALGKGFWQVFIAVGLTMWVEVARIVRGQVISVKEVPYITAANALGYSDFRIISSHILPNILAPVIVISAANFAAAILIESGLSFLGIGAQPPVPTWGNMIKEHYNYIILGKAHLAIIPGLAIMSLVMAFMMVGNTLRDVFDVKS
jgi:peptide/nickel transport system permease protein